MPAPTPSQTIGPFPHEGWRWAFDDPAADGALVLEGRVLDGDGAPVDDALIEAWQPGVPTESVAALTGWHRVATDAEGRFRLALAARPAAGEPAAHLVLFARGLLTHCCSAVFLGDDPALADAPLLAQVPADRRATLAAEPVAPRRYRWDWRLQGTAETVCFDFA